MRLEHVAVWTNDLERLCAFYERHFGARAGTRYRSTTRAGFTSSFLAFDEGGARIEGLHEPRRSARRAPPSRDAAGRARVPEDAVRPPGSRRPRPTSSEPSRGPAVVAVPHADGDR